MAETQFKYDVFISYNHADEKWVVGTLLPALEQAGLKVCIDFRDLTGGEIAILDIQNAIKASRQFIFVLTRNWKEGKWAQLEARLAGTLTATNVEYKIIPLVCEKGIEKKVDEFITMRNWIDFTGKDQSLAWKQLFDALGKPGNSTPDTSHLALETRWFYGHRYGDIQNFTGRAAELKMLDDWLANDTDNLLLITAFGGFGKSALTWQWFNNRVDKTKWQTAIWWSFYEKESGFESFLAETLAHLGVEVKASARLQVNDLLETMRGTNILIVLDGFERLLRQYGRMDAALQSDDEDAEIDPSQRDCSSPLTETFLRGLSGAGLKSKVLLTTRLCPRVLESADGKPLKGCREAPLAAFAPEDAVTYFQDEGVKATRAEISALCAAYGYHPLSLSLLVGLINADHERRGDIEAVKNLEIFEDVKARRHHVLERAYGSLAPERRDLLSKMSCFRGSMEYAVLKKVFPSPDLDKALLDLRQRGLILVASSPQSTNSHLPASQITNSQSTRFDMHPIVRHYAYDHFTDEKRRKEAHVQLAMHFIDVMPVTKAKAKSLEDLAPVIELYHHIVGAGNLDEAAKLFRERLANTLYFQFGAYQLCIELLRALFLDGEDKPPRLKPEAAQAQILNDLAAVYSLSGQPRRSVPLFESIVRIDEKNKDKSRDAAVTLGAIASVGYLPIGALSKAKRNHRRRIDLCREVENDYEEAIGHRDLGQVLFYLGEWSDSEKELEIAEKLFEKGKNVQSLGVTWSYRALRFLLIARANPKSQIENLKSSIECAQRALELTDEQAKDYPVPRDYVRAHWLLGAAYRTNAELTLAEENLTKALSLCRQINLVEMEADILLDVARLYYAYGSRYGGGGRVDEVRIETPPPTRPSAEEYFKDAQEKASEALVITERSGYVLQGADVNLFLATLALEGYRLQVTSSMSDKEAAKFHAQEALKLATCDGPPYYYKVAYEEAEAMLEKLALSPSKG